MHDAASTHVLLRTRDVTPGVLKLADHLEALSGHPVSLVVDASRGAVQSNARSLIQLSAAACGQLGLHCPANFAWQCGDYGYYLARRRFPEASRFWMIETDVRFCGEDPGYFFRFFATRNDVDFLGARLQVAPHSWFWIVTAMGWRITPFRCFFPVTRLSARAIDAVLAHRIRHGKHLTRRILWPNDEAMVATTLMNGGFVSRDFNDFGQAFYSQETYFYGKPMNGDTLKLPPLPVQLIHPVLSGSEYTDKILALQQAAGSPNSWATEKMRWTACKINARLRW